MEQSPEADVFARNPSTRGGMMSCARPGKQRGDDGGRLGLVDGVGTTMTQSGWFADPVGRHQQRFFNGLIWTSDVLDGDVRGVDPLSATTVEQPATAQPAGTYGQVSWSGWQAPTAQAWRDGDELVIRAGVPLPPICVFCGAPAVAGIRTAINSRGHPLANLQILTTRIPVCDDDRRRNRAAIVTGNVTVIVLFVMMLFGIAPGWLAFVPNGVAYTLPTVRALAIALATFLAIHLARLWWRQWSGARPLRLRIVRSRAGFIWLRNADPRYLAQLPAVAPAP